MLIEQLGVSRRDSAALADHQLSLQLDLSIPAAFRVSGLRDSRYQPLAALVAGPSIKIWKRDIVSYGFIEGRVVFSPQPPKH